MKKALLIIVLLLLTVKLYSKNIHTVIYQNDLSALQKYIDKHEFLDEIITMEGGAEFHIMEYAAYFNRLSCLKLIVKTKPKIIIFKLILKNKN